MKKLGFMVLTLVLLLAVAAGAGNFKKFQTVMNDQGFNYFNTLNGFRATKNPMFPSG